MTIMRDSVESLKAPILSLHGPDGCGKSAIAEALDLRLNELGYDPKVFGASSFEQWMDTPTMRDFLGSSETFDNGTAAGATADEKTRLYEDIAICMIGVAGRYADKDGPVVIDSDAYMKRIVWARLSLGEDEFWQYVDRFDDRLTDAIGDQYVSHLGHVTTSPEEAHSRLHGRGYVSEYDPETLEECQTLGAAITEINTELVIAERYPRLVGVELFNLPNGHSDDVASTVRGHVDTITKAIGVE